MNVRRQGYKEGMGNTFGLMETVHIVNIKVALYMTTVIFVKIHILGHKRLILSLINYNATNLTSKEKKKCAIRNVDPKTDTTVHLAPGRMVNVSHPNYI